MRISVALGFLVSILLALSAPQTTWAHGLDKKTVATALKSVVSVLPQQLSSRQKREEPEGSGVVIGDGSSIITAAHVLGQSQEVLIRTSDGKILNAKITKRDSETDLALLKVETALPPIRWAETAFVSEPACAIGNGFGLGLSVACGVVSANGRSGVGFNPIEDFVQTDAAVNPGMSGGALINANGELMGILSAIFTKSSDSNIGVNFAVSSRLAHSVLRDIEDNGILDREHPGIRLKPHNGTDGSGIIGAMVDLIGANSAEKAAGILIQDIVIAAGGRRILKPADFIAVVAMLRKDTLLPVLLLRDGKPTELTIDYWK